MPLPVFKLLQQAGFHVAAYSFLKIDYLFDPALERQVNAFAQQQINVVFTSQHAVKAVAQLLNTVPTNWNIYCIGGITQSYIEQLWPKLSIQQSAFTAQELLAKIPNTINASWVFFCGNRSLDSLPKGLREKGFHLESCKVYHNDLLYHQIQETYDAIMFYSPSGVNAYLQQNTIAPHVIIVAIGTTTAQYLAEKISNKILIAPKPEKMAMAQCLIQYYLSSENKNHNA